MTPELFQRLVAEAALAPSVHNTQPARWRLDSDQAVLLEDTERRLPAGDPDGHDASISVGAALEGLVIAARSEGLNATVSFADELEGTLRVRARLTFSNGSETDPLAAFVDARRSWRGQFVAPEPDDTRSAMELTSEDCAVVSHVDEIARVARLCDVASLRFMTDDPFRLELLRWMRLRMSHPRWGVDGLNADALQFGRFERLFAGLALGPAFRVIRALGLASVIVSDADTTKTATAIVIFHRPRGEDPVETGQAFYRAWLRMEAAGFGAAVMAALADDAQTSGLVAKLIGLADDRRIVSAFRIGRRPAHDTVPRARIATADLIV